MSVLIELKNVGVEFGGQTILQEINLRLQPGKITAIIGSSGSGLSVLLKTAAGLTSVCCGEVLYDNRPLDSFTETEKRQLQTRTGFMFQDAALWANMNIFANLDLPLQTKFPDLNAEQRKQRIEAALQQYGFSVDTKKRPVEISQGQKKFVSFLRAVIPEPEALFLDEPVAWMDKPWAEKISNELVALRARGTILVLASTQKEPAIDLADHLVVLHHGKILAQGEFKDIALSPDPKVQSLLDGETVD